jgi:hypothetical protein
MNLRLAVSKINKHHVLLVFPVKNKQDPESLWHQFFPRKKMRWEWDSEGDLSVFEMWMLMKKLSDSGQVVYSKWYQGRATFFSKELFVAMLCLQLPHPRLSPIAQRLLDTLENNSPLSTKQLKLETDLRGKDNEPAYSRAMKELFKSLQIVAYGEVDDGAFPSLAVGATKNLFEELWDRAQTMKKSQALAFIDDAMPEGSEFRKFYDRQMKHAMTPA